jgi:hypothetical protein
MIIVKLHGGLGNQMFQYAFSKNLAKVRGESIAFVDDTLNGVTKRKYELSYFNIKPKFVDKKKATELDKLYKNKTPKIIRRFLKQPKYLVDCYLDKNLFVFDKKVYKTDKKYFVGYWQNEKYFNEIRKELLKDFTSKKNITKKLKQNSVSIHIRRGDYIKNPQVKQAHGACDMNYYKTAINLIEDKVENPFFYVFSDDIVWCKKNFKFLKNVEFISNKQPYMDIVLMSKCEHNIIANSSFSWWGAWLNENDNKIVIAPKSWMKSYYKSPVPKEWIKI